MSVNPNHHVCVHGHFYQPPRENPWLGVIEPQESAAPFHDWNERIDHECYAALTRAPIRGETRRIVDMFNVYAHVSFNFGATLLAWLAEHDPATLEAIREADRWAAEKHGGHGSAMAQAYNHPILPLCDARDRQTQIVWGLREFRHRYGRDAEGFWCPECAIDRHTVRALIDHGVQYVILGPQQAEAIRPFGYDDWTDVRHGGLETRHPYRLFEVDGAGRTHFDRYLDVVFFDRDLSLQVSFNHLLQDPERFEWSVRERLADDATLPQLVMITTDGEAYGHHEKTGHETLGRFFATMGASGRLQVANLGAYLEAYPPHVEVRLWEGEEGKGSSWSCDQGVARWEKHTGCNGTGEPGWSQAWRAPVRAAFDRLRGHVREVYRREVGALLIDGLEARNDYIRVLLDPTAETRAAFLRRHHQRTLTAEEVERVWTLLEADLNAQLMYTSCGWFFFELSGLEPTQNMRYAVRAAELIQPFVEHDLIEELSGILAEAHSNIPEQGNGADVLREHVLSTRYGPERIAATHAMLRLFELPEPTYRIRGRVRAEERTGGIDAHRALGEVETEDRATGATRSFRYLAAALPEGPLGVLLADPEDQEAVDRWLRLDPAGLAEALTREGVLLADMPYDDRQAILETHLAERIRAAESTMEASYGEIEPLLAMHTANRLPAPPAFKPLAREALSERLGRLTLAVAMHGAARAEDLKAARRLNEAAHTCQVELDLVRPSRAFATLVRTHMASLLTDLNLAGVDRVVGLLRFGKDAELWFENWTELEALFWRLLSLPPRPESQDSTTHTLVERVRELGDLLQFDPETVAHRTRVLFSTSD